MEAALGLRDIKNGTTVSDQINIETLEAGEDTISKTLAKLYTKGLSEKGIPTAWKNAKMAIIFKKGNKEALNNYRPLCQVSNICKVLTKVPTKRLLNENQPREQAQLKEKCRE